MYGGLICKYDGEYHKPLRQSCRPALFCSMYQNKMHCDVEYN